eukprot:scaffold410_cov267-Chaetoceros_neogracile.AAC.2
MSGASAASFFACSLGKLQRSGVAFLACSEKDAKDFEALEVLLTGNALVGRVLLSAKDERRYNTKTDADE